MYERLQKVLSARGVSSRRGAEELIQKQRVFVNGIPAQLGMKVDPDTDEILVDGKKLNVMAEKVYIMLNKPVGYVTTVHDEKGRKTVMDLVSNVGVHIYPIGRLDLNSEGLLLLTNDGEFANHVMHPSNVKTKIYRVSVIGNIIDAEKILSQPMNIDETQVHAAQVRIVRLYKDGGVIEISIFEGRNRQIRKMCNQAGLCVKKLCRISIGGVNLGTLPKGKWRNLTQSEIDLLAN